MQTDRVAVVTGGTGGIGRVTAERLASDGLAVAVMFGGDEDAAQKVVVDLTSAGGRALAVRADVADEGQVAEAFDHVERELGGVDVVVHTAGIMRLSPLTELDLADLDGMHRVNIRGTFVVAQQAVRRIRAGGAIITFSSSIVKLGLPTYSAYAASKAAAEAISPILARELRGRDVTVNTVAPGPTATKLFLDGKDQATIDHLAGLSPFGRMGQPADTAEVISFLAGPGRWVDGQTIYVNGGAV